MADSTLDFEYIGTIGFVDGTINVSTHGGEREQTVVLSNFRDKPLSTAITVEVKQVGKKRRRLFKRRDVNFSAFAAKRIFYPPLRSCSGSLHAFGPPENSTTVTTLELGSTMI